MAFKAPQRALLVKVAVEVLGVTFEQNQRALPVWQRPLSILLAAMSTPMVAHRSTLGAPVQILIADVGPDVTRSGISRVNRAIPGQG